MEINKGPYTLQWGQTVLEDITAVDINTDINSDDFETLQGQTKTVDGARKASATITLLKTDIEALSAVLPQYFVADGQVLSTGETVSNAEGAIDVVDDCGDNPIYRDFQIVSCGNPGQVLRLNNCRTRLDSIDNPVTARTVKVMFIGEPESGQAMIQFYNEGGINPNS